MALTNAERQRRFIQKLKSAAVTNEIDALRQRIAELEAEVEKLKAKAAAAKAKATAKRNIRKTQQRI
jgi:ubiquinone biosynthesis protein UbiJ